MGENNIRDAEGVIEILRGRKKQEDWNYVDKTEGQYTDDEDFEESFMSVKNNTLEPKQTAASAIPTSNKTSTPRYSPIKTRARGRSRARSRPIAEAGSMQKTFQKVMDKSVRKKEKNTSK